MQKSFIENKLKKHIPTLISLYRNDKSFSAKGNATSSLNKSELENVSKALLSLQRGLTGERTLAGKGYMQNDSLLGAYLLYYWCISYLQISYATQTCYKNLNALIQNCKDLNEPLRILDVGSGPAPASSALCDMIQSENKININVTLTDSSQKSLALAKNIFNKDFNSVQVKTTVYNFEKDGIKNFGKQDIIVLSHSLNELWQSKEDSILCKKNFLLELSSKLNPNGLLILCEPALLATSRNLIALRNELVKEGFYLLAPCMQNDLCPALSAGENQTCHAQVAWNPIEPVCSIAQKAKLERNCVKMTFFVFSKTKSLNANDCYRVVSDGMLNKAGRYRFLLCNGKQRIAFSAKKDDLNAKKQGFFSLQRYDTISIQNPELRGDKQTTAFGFTESTIINVR